MLANISKQLLDHFTNRLIEDFTTYCHRHKITEERDDFITFLIDKKVLDATTMRRFTIRKEFEELYPKHEYHKTRTVKALADKFHLSERAVWTIIKNNPNK